MKRPIRLKDNNTVKPCPKCGNNTEFRAHAEQCAEDHCEVWVVCKCGYDPTDSSSRLEDIWGSLDPDAVMAAMFCWNEAIEEIYGVEEAE